MKVSIDGARVAKLRDHLGKTLDELARTISENARVSDGGLRPVHLQTIHKIEAGHVRTTKLSTAKSIAKALMVDVKVLTGEADMPQELGTTETPTLEPYYLPASHVFSRKQFQALQAVAMRYRVPVGTIFEYAPALFAIAAEQSLRHRAATLDTLKEQVRTLAGLHDSLPHLGQFPFYPRDYGDMAVAEQISIERRDIYGKATLAKIDDEEEQYPVDPADKLVTNPFVTFIRQAAEAVDLDVERDFMSPDELRLSLPWTWFDAITGGDEELNRELARASILLRDIPRSLMKRDRLSDRQDWLREQLLTDPIAVMNRNLENLDDLIAADDAQASEAVDLLHSSKPEVGHV